MDSIPSLLCSVSRCSHLLAINVGSLLFCGAFPIQHRQQYPLLLSSPVLVSVTRIVLLLISINATEYRTERNDCFKLLQELFLPTLLLCIRSKRRPALTFLILLIESFSGF